MKKSDGAFGDDLRHFREQFEGVLQVLDHFVGQFVGFGEVGAVFDGLVLEPGEVEVEFVAFFELRPVVRAPAAVRIVFAPRRLALVERAGAIAGVEIIEVGEGDRLLFEGKMEVGAQVIDPQFLGLGLGGAGFLVEKQDVRLHAGLVEDGR